MRLLTSSPITNGPRFIPNVTPTDRTALDWASQPNPFRRFEGAPLLRLPLTDPDKTPAAAASLFGAATVTPQPLTLGAVSLFLELS